MYKKILVLSLLIIATLMMIGCRKDNSNSQQKDKKGQEDLALMQEEVTITPTEATPAPEATPTPEAIVDIKNEHGEFIPNEMNVKTLGRTYLQDKVLWLSQSATGIEFTFSGTLCQIDLIGDTSVTTAGGKGHEARVGIYLNDELVEDILMDEVNKTITVHEGDLIEGRVRLVKLSESSDSSLGIRGIKTDGESIKPTPNKSLRIEFIGDSITCGYGVDDKLGGKYSTANENAAKSYAYKTAGKLDADYSMVAYSGYGIISGYTSNGDINPTSILPPYYNKFGKSYFNMAADLAPISVNWEFNKFSPHIIVINLGTNDSSYCGTDTVKSTAFSNLYTKFLHTVREKNSDAYIICSFGIMGDTLYPYIEDAVTKYKEESGDTKISSMKFDVQLSSDGYAVDWHPSEKTHEKAADKLVSYIKELGLTN